MLAATLEVVTRDLDRRVAAAQSRTGRDPAARLRALVRACLEVAVRRPEFWVVFVEFWGEMLHDRRLRDLNTAVYTRTRRLLGRLITEGVRAGHFRAVDPTRARRRGPRSGGRPLAAAHVRSGSVQRRRGHALLRRGARSLSRQEGIVMTAEEHARARAREYFATNGTQAPAAQIHERVVRRLRRAGRGADRCFGHAGGASTDPGRVVGAGDRGSPARDASPRGGRAALPAGRSAPAGRAHSGRVAVEGAAAPALVVAARGAAPRARRDPRSPGGVPADTSTAARARRS